MNKTTVTLVLLVGLPGSGKSTLCRFIINSRLGDWNRIVHLEYDETYRRLLAENENSEESNDLSLTRDTWRNSRKAALHELNLILDQVATTSERHSDYHVLILLDDNFYLRSMRRNVYKSVLQFVQTSQYYSNLNQRGLEISLHFSTLYLDVSLQTCLERNSIRIGQDRVADSVIHNMADRMQGFSTMKRMSHLALFEKHYLVLQDTDVQLIRSAEGASFLENICMFLYQSRSKPVIDMNLIHQIQLQSQIDEEPSVKDIPSLVHTCDLLLRFLVKVTCEEDKLLAPLANQTRKQVLDLVKQKHDMCPPKVHHEEMKFWNHYIFQRYSSLLIAALSTDTATTREQRYGSCISIESLVQVLNDAAMREYGVV